jgi:hypothetical protein
MTLYGFIVARCHFGFQQLQLDHHIEDMKNFQSDKAAVIATIEKLTVIIFYLYIKNFVSFHLF